MTLHSRARKGADAIEDSTWRRPSHLRMGLSAILVSSLIGLLGAPTLAQASAITPSAFCAKIPAATVSSLFGQKIKFLGALAQGAGNDVCEFAKIVGGKASGVTLNYNYKGTGTVSSNVAALKKAKGVSKLVLKPYTSIGGTTYSFTDTFSDPTLHIKIMESGMESFSGSNHYGVIVTKVLPTSTLAKLLNLVVKAA
jgi:hypothetical protein